MAFARRGAMVNKLLRFLKRSEMATDPVCRMEVPVDKPGGGTFEHQGSTYYFRGPAARRHSRTIRKATSRARRK
jgi:YHS domain-containing protein